VSKASAAAGEASAEKGEAAAAAGAAGMVTSLKQDQQENRQEQ
jgi:hypothetical protein